VGAGEVPSTYVLQGGAVVLLALAGNAWGAQRKALQ